jgi:hypothetical protein
MELDFIIRTFTSALVEDCLGTVLVVAFVVAVRVVFNRMSR